MIQLKVNYHHSNDINVYINKRTQLKHSLIENIFYRIELPEKQDSLFSKTNKYHCITKVKIDNRIDDETIKLSKEIAVQLGFPTKISLRQYTGKIHTAKVIKVFPCLYPLINCSQQITFLNEYKDFDQLSQKIVQIGNVIELKRFYAFEEHHILLDSIGYYSFRIVDIIDTDDTVIENKEQVFYQITEETKISIDSSQKFNRTITKKVPTSLFIANRLNAKEMYTQFKQFMKESQQYKIVKEILIQGEEGIGKRTLLQQIACTLGCNFVRIDTFMKSYSRTSNGILDIITKACQALPLIILFDNCTEYNFSEMKFYSSILQKELTSKISVYPSSFLSLICVYNFNMNVIPDATLPVVHFRNFDIDDLERIKEYLQLPSDCILPKGLTFTDCQELKMKYEALPILTSELNTIAKHLSQQHTCRIEIPSVHWEDVGGCHEAKKQIQYEVKRIREQNENHGIMFYGPPGTGKTLLAKAIATEYHMSFFTVRGPELFSKYVGETEQNVRNLFSIARENKPSIIFFDEIDAIASSRKGGNVYDRVVGQILSEMQGVGVDGGVLVIAATNRIDQIDKSLLVPGRFDISIEIGLVKGDERKEIISAQLHSLKHEEDIDLDLIVSKMKDNVSGAYISSIIQNAYKKARQIVVERYNNGENVSSDDIIITQEQIISSLQ